MERSIRQAVSVIWERNRPFLEALACRSLVKKPRPAEFLAILAAALGAGSNLGESALHNDKVLDA